MAIKHFSLILQMYIFLDLVKHNYYQTLISWIWRGHMVVGFTTTCAMSA